MENNSRLHVFIYGHVHGVGFRYYVLQRATQLNIQGFVRNRIDGSVEVMAEGNKSNLVELLGTLRQGPQLSYITQVKHSWLESKDKYSGFKILVTI